MDMIMFGVFLVKREPVGGVVILGVLPVVGE